MGALTHSIFNAANDEWLRSQIFSECKFPFFFLEKQMSENLENSESVQGSCLSEFYVSLNERLRFSVSSSRISVDYAMKVAL